MLRLSFSSTLLASFLSIITILGAAAVSELDGEPEDMVFALPKELRLRLVS